MSDMKSLLSKLPNPLRQPEPRKIAFKELYEYESISILKMRQNFKSARGALPYIGKPFLSILIFSGYPKSGGCLGFCLIGMLIADKVVSFNHFGDNGNGGRILNIYTRNSDSEIQYNRNFQKMCYMTENAKNEGSALAPPPELLRDLGFEFKQSGMNYKVSKRSPHWKYFY
jgi:hypothetical protein